MKKYMMVGEYMIEFTNKDVSEDVNIELSDEENTLIWLGGGNRIWAQRIFQT